MTKKEHQLANETQTIIWCMNAQAASTLVSKAYKTKINVLCHAEYNLCIFKSSPTEKEYKRLFAL